ncbi:uncharacterized protein LOC132628484 [Lycium barbarum]|uniref:uncharacterized protein LOC132628484 n=1 Tax=Lycium barbarum TaxID=112863 RepID=UPI00293E80D4|nr:uncharacterized protein LOC132628484 [Lycium barbarum]
MKIKNKLKHFSRKCLLNALPVKSVLAKRLRLQDATCRVCGMEEEAVEHMFFHCPRSLAVWKMSPFLWPNIDRVNNFASSWYNFFLNAKKFPEPMNLLNLSVHLMWFIWKARNSWTFNNEMWDVSNIMSQALFDYHKFKELGSISNTQNDISLIDEQLIFCQDEVLFLTDASVQKDTGDSSIGVVAVDARGSMLHAFGSPIQSVGKPSIVEAIAVREALKIAGHKGWRKVHILSDAMKLVMISQGLKSAPWPVQNV